MAFNPDLQCGTVTMTHCQYRRVSVLPQKKTDRTSSQRTSDGQREKERGMKALTFLFQLGDSGVQGLDDKDGEGTNRET